MSSEPAWEADVLPASNTPSIATAKAEGFTARSDKDEHWIFVLQYAIPAWLSIIVNCYDDKNRDAIV